MLVYKPASVSFYGLSFSFYVLHIQLLTLLIERKALSSDSGGQRQSPFCPTGAELHSSFARLKAQVQGLARPLSWDRPRAGPAQSGLGSRARAAVSQGWGRSLRAGSSAAQGRHRDTAPRVTAGRGAQGCRARGEGC